MVIINASAAKVTSQIDIEKTGWNDGRMVADLLNPSMQYRVNNHSIEIDLPAWNGKWIG